MDSRGSGFGVGLPRSRQVVVAQVLGKSLFFWLLGPLELGYKGTLCWVVQSRVYRV